MDLVSVPGKLPAIQFYGGDWLRDSVAGCSLAAQGLWLRMMIVMHDCDPYGYLVQSGLPMPDKAVAARCGTDIHTYKTLLAELDAAGVPSRCDTGILYSRRLVRDEENRRKEREKKRLQRGGEKPHEVCPPVVPPVVPPDVPPLSPPSSSSSSTSVVSASLTDDPPKPRRLRKEPAGEHHELIRHWCQGWERRYGRKFPFQAASGRNGKTIQILLDNLGFADAVAAMDRYLACNDGFLNGHPLGMLLSQLPKFLVQSEDDGLDPADRKMIKEMEDEDERRRKKQAAV